MVFLTFSVVATSSDMSPDFLRTEFGILIYTIVGGTMGGLLVVAAILFVRWIRGEPLRPPVTSSTPPRVFKAGLAVFGVLSVISFSAGLMLFGGIFVVAALFYMGGLYKSQQRLSKQDTVLDHSKGQ